jgi:hypothetical protein
LVALAALIAAAKWFRVAGPSSVYGFDFRGTVWLFGGAALAGDNPYPAPAADLLLVQGSPAVYPPALLGFAVPLSLLPFTAALILWNIVNFACVIAALRLAGVRDWRVHAIVLVSMPLTATLILGQIEGLSAICCALVWRFRDQLWPAALAVATAVAMKIVLWPLALWLVFIRRWRSGVLGLATAAIVSLVAWAGIGFAGLTDYPRLLVADSDAFEDDGLSAAASGVRADLSTAAARPLASAVAILLLLLSYGLARAGQADRSFAAAVGAGVLGSPIVWMHSLLVLFIALAIVRPRFDLAWLVPLTLGELVVTTNQSLGQFIAAQVAICALVVATVLQPRRPPRPRPHATPLATP